MDSDPGTSPSLRHLLERVGLVEQHLLDEFDRRRELEDDHDDWRLRGVYVTEQQVDELLLRPHDRAVPVSPHLERFLSRLEQRVGELESEGHEFRLRDLASRWGLDELDVHLLLVAAAASIDARFELVYGYLNDDVNQRTPTVGLAVQLAGLPTSSPEARRRLAPEGRLLGLGLIEVRPDETRSPIGWTISCPARVVAHLLGDDTPDRLLRPVTVPLPAVDGATAGRLGRVLAAGNTPVYVLDPSMGTAMSAAAAAAEHSGVRCLGIDLVRLPEGASAFDVVAAARREAVLTGAVLVVAGADVIAAQDRRAVEHLTDARVPVVLCGREPWSPAWSVATPMTLRAEEPSRAAKARLWKALLGDDVERIDVDGTLAPLRVNAQQALGAVRIAREHAAANDRPLVLADVLVGVRSQDASGLQRLASRIEPTNVWTDLVVPEQVRAELRLMATRWRNRDRVFGDWDVATGGGRGRGVSALFAGPSGTGKTLAAQVVAAELGLDLYIVDLSTVVDKYIGETSKNIDRIFEEADRVNGVLLFDEADALFGKRSAVSDSKDRNANLEVAHLLQRMESFDGIAILTTNLASNLDDAFLRRLDAIIDFPRPDVTVREQLWRTLLGDDLPLDGGVDPTELAERFRLSGGEIRNVVLTAAFWAAEQGGPVTMELLLRAGVREHRKIQKPLSAADLGPHAHLLE